MNRTKCKKSHIPNAKTLKALKEAKAMEDVLNALKINMEVLWGYSEVVEKEKKTGQK